MFLEDARSRQKLTNTKTVGKLVRYFNNITSVVVRGSSVAFCLSDDALMSHFEKETLGIVVIGAVAVFAGRQITAQ